MMNCVHRAKIMGFGLNRVFDDGCFILVPAPTYGRPRRVTMWLETGRKTLERYRRQ